MEGTSDWDQHVPDIFPLSGQPGATLFKLYIQSTGLCGVPVTFREQSLQPARKVNKKKKKGKYRPEKSEFTGFFPSPHSRLIFKPQSAVPRSPTSKHSCVWDRLLQSEAPFTHQIIKITILTPRFHTFQKKHANNPGEQVNSIGHVMKWSVSLHLVNFGALWNPLLSTGVFITHRRVVTEDQTEA